METYWQNSQQTYLKFITPLKGGDFIGINVATLPEPNHPTIDAIYAHYERRPDAPRPHLGASEIGNPCDRALWYSFRWAKEPSFPGRILRLFLRGQNEESVFINELRSIGVQVFSHNEQGRQHSVSFHSGHFGGSTDGIALELLESPKTPHVLEFKTHSEKSFNDLKAKGVKESKPMHWAQCQVYMHGLKLTRAYYLAVNKNTDELYSERIHYDKAAAEKLVEKAEIIITGEVPPLRLSDDPANWQCKYCPYHVICHGKELPRVSCRTCCHATPVIITDDYDTAPWSCAFHELAIPYEGQLEACGDHLYIPELLANVAKSVDASTEENWIEYETPAGKRFRNGSADADATVDGCFDSYEIRASAAAGLDLLADTALLDMRERFGARVAKTEDIK